MWMEVWKIMSFVNCLTKWLNQNISLLIDEEMVLVSLLTSPPLEVEEAAGWSNFLGGAPGPRRSKTLGFLLVSEPSASGLVLSTVTRRRGFPLIPLNEPEMWGGNITIISRCPGPTYTGIMFRAFVTSKAPWRLSKGKVWITKHAYSYFPLGTYV